MRKLASIALFSVLASACGAPPSPGAPRVAPAKTVAGATTAAPPVPETLDSPSRYVPPDRVIPPAGVPSPVDLTLSNGIPARLVEKHGSPVVSLILIVRWKTIAKIPGTSMVLGAAFPRLRLPSGRELGDELTEVGATVGVLTDQDAAYVRLSALRDGVEPALSLIVAALRSGKLDAAGLDRARAMVRVNIERESDESKNDRLVDAQLFPASHRYHDQERGTLESIDKLKADDLMRFRDAALGPDAVSIAVAGALSKSDLSATLERVFGSWTAGAPPKAPAPSSKAQEVAPLGMTHGVFVHPESSATGAEVTLVIPMPDGRKSDMPAALAAWAVLVERATQKLRDAFPANESPLDSPHVLRDAFRHGRSPLGSHLRQRALGRTIQLYADAQPGECALVADLLFKAMEDVAKGDFSDRELTHGRRSRAVGSTPGDGIEELVWPVAVELSSGAPPGAELFVGRAVEAVSREDIVRAASVYFRKDRASVVAVGGARSEKKAFEKLGAGPVTFVTPSKNGAKK